jgi:HK97 family phage prohead protease
VGEDALEHVRRRDVVGASFGFRDAESEWSMGADGIPVRDVVDMQLIEISPTPAPAYRQTSLTVE